VSATWAPDSLTKITRTRKAFVQAGKTTELDLSQEDPKQPDKIEKQGSASPALVGD
jgi:hypothetical protein